MSQPIPSPGGDYRYAPAAFQYSNAVVAAPGFALERARFRRPVPLPDAFAAIEAHLAALDRPTTAFAHCELRIAAPFTDQGFIDFNRQYVTTLERWGLYRDEKNPVARTNVCPAYGAPAVPSMHAFTYTVPLGARGPGAANAPRPSFVLSGAGDAKGGAAPYAERVVRYQDTSPEALREKVLFVIAEMERRLASVGAGWADAVSTQAYTTQNIGHLVGELLAARGAIASGLVWHYARPPVLGLEFEMDVRGDVRESILDA
ncbi:MAG: hypothetical protein AB7P21_05020 [Lautropia sp.]